MAGTFDWPKAIHCAFTAVLALGAVVAAPSAWSQEQSEPRQLAAIPATGRSDYDVIREGERIGDHSVVFRHDGRRITVATRTDIDVKLLGVTLYRFRYEAEEDWFDGQLTRLKSSTDRDGETLTVNLARAGNRIRGVCNGMNLDLPASVLPISMWHPDFVRQSVILDQYNCVERKVSIANDGIEPIFAGSKNLTARHYAVTGELQRDVWYGPDGQIVRVAFPSEGGSEIAFVTPSPPQQALASEQRPSSSSAGRDR